MKTNYIAIEKNTLNFDDYNTLWKKRDIIGVWANTMTDGIQKAIELSKSNSHELYFVSIVANEIPDFMEKLSILRNETTAPILIATHNYTEKEHHEALNNGADFYAHFCETNEENIDGVIAAINSINRKKHENSPSNILIHKGIMISLSQRKAFINDLHTLLTRQEYDMLLCFMSNIGNALSYEQINAIVRDDKYSDSSVDVIKSTIKRLRKKIAGDENDNRIIENIRGYGYKMPF